MLHVLFTLQGVAAIKIGLDGTYSQVDEVKKLFLSVVPSSVS